MPAYDLKKVDEKNILETVRRHLKSLGYQVIPTHTLSDVLNALEKTEYENKELRDTLSRLDLHESINRTLSSCQVLKLTLQTTFHLLKPEASVLFLRDALSGRYEIRDFCARDPRRLEEVIGTPNLTALESTIGNASYLSTLNGPSEPFFHRMPTFGNLRTFFSVPIRRDNFLLGFLNTYDFESETLISEPHRQMVAELISKSSDALDGRDFFENLRSTFKETIQLFADALDRKDSYTAGHSDRTHLFCEMICDGLHIEGHEREIINDAAKLHDIGKLGVDLSTLNNPGKLSKSEIENFRSHPTYGKQILEPIFFFSDLIPLVHLHHENFDGSGYPNGISKLDIPFGARVIAVADSYDAMTSHRAYRRALGHKAAVQEMMANAGTQFDPEVVRAFIEKLEEHIRNRTLPDTLKNLADS